MGHNNAPKPRLLHAGKVQLTVPKVLTTQCTKPRQRRERHNGERRREPSRLPAKVSFRFHYLQQQQLCFCVATFLNSLSEDTVIGNLQYCWPSYLCGPFDLPPQVSRR